MLRSRFNRNKEMAQAAAGSYIRTSESSEGKSNSPKNSPICPVKPTPAPVCRYFIFILLNLLYIYIEYYYIYKKKFYKFI